MGNSDMALVLFFGMMVGAVLAVILSVSIESFKERDKKTTQQTVRKIAKTDAVGSKKGTRTLEELIEYHLDRPMTVSDLEYAHSLYKGYVEEEEKLHKERLSIRNNFYSTVDEYRDSNRHLLR